ncbi:MAG: CDP-alcohol phosphatidyltransferase family protein [Alphaproteobacteria bacterium]|nr:CDP-alcohol phosphatidyltransferase family protein [Alphaproteobacteria bacterium]MBM3624547.1 CDP-alcohol phosphatidyltransferase family protein [Alphaproteobacteria bacterium]
MANQRINESFLALKERAALAALVRRLPHWATPDHLTAIGLCGAVLTFFSFVGCRWSNGFLVGVVFGLFLNWFGDSLDGTLARYRSIERPYYGYFIDHSSDLIAQTLIIIGLGVSPFFTVSSSLLALSLYLLMSSYTYLRVVTESVHRLSYGGMGATEFRILVAGWALFAAWCGPGLVTAQAYGFAVLDIVIGVLSALTFLGFLVVIHKDLLRLQREEREVIELPEPATVAHEHRMSEEDEEGWVESVAR